MTPGYLRYLRILIWVGRATAILALFYPLGLYLGVTLLLLSELVHLLLQSLVVEEEGGGEHA